MSNIVDLKFDYCEYQILFHLENSSISLEQKILESGAKRIGVLFEEEEYWIPRNSDIENPPHILRIRREDEKSYLSVVKNKKSDRKELFYQLTQNKLTNREKIDECLKGCRQVAKFHKRRIIFIKDNIQINLEQISIPKLGTFINFTFSSEEELKNIIRIIKSLELNVKSALKYGYYNYVIQRMGKLNKFYHFLYDLLGTTSFGISAAILSILGLMLGIYAALSTKIAIISSIVSLALADSLADTYALYSQKKMKGFSSKKALRFGFSNFLSRFLLTSSFILPFLFLETLLSILINLIIGFIVLIILNLLISIYQESNKIKSLAKSILFSLIVLFGSYFVGTLIKILF
ncbi:MAG: hypothetical protein GF353_28780 [Candidatus Lokiarchaeota archaeon]|nr:hypothetical protein [Candidatus Lokiarchaeota archaeon]